METNPDIDVEKYVARATQLFKEGYNCAQAVTLALADLHGLDADLLARLAGPFGGGIGRMRGVCGAANGIFMMSGLATAKPGSYPDATVKKRCYAAVQQMAEAFRRENGSLICSDLLARCSAQPVSTAPTPEARTPQYYAKRPCIKIVEQAIRIYLKWLQEQQTPDSNPN